MAEASRPPSGEQEEPVNIITVPKHLTQRVAEYVKSLLDADQDDTSGYMIGGLSTTAVRSTALRGRWTGTICGPYNSGSLGEDTGCADQD